MAWDKRGTTFEERFWARVDRRGPDECWPWTGFIGPNGYTQAMALGRRGTTAAHRVAFQLAHGVALARHQHVRQTCANPVCCNPAHLVRGTWGEFHAQRAARRSLTPPYYTGRLDGVARFWSHVRFSPGCWEWTGCAIQRRSGPVGRFVVDGKIGSAHHYSYELAYGVLAPGQIVRRTCDNPRCVRPGHLALGRRPAKPRRTSVDTRRRLTPAQIQEALRREAEGTLSAPAFARECGVAHTTLWRAMRGKTWRKLVVPRAIAPQVRLTAALVQEARRRKAEGTLRIAPFARAHGVKPSALWHAVAGETWKHLPHPAVTE